MRPLLAIISKVLGAKMIQVLRPDDDESIQAFLLDRLNEPLHIGVRVR
jgi:hypothetical protein